MVRARLFDLFAEKRDHVITGPDLARRQDFGLCVD
jgi:hypothetical protein